ncbi:MAG TPA: rhodanese-like domain-containing protein [Candidatus Eisenbacteria bacterium]|nr:rhodanese-like domain-containing protein [Candidatus Eisenbacteria bacterium]
MPRPKIIRVLSLTSLFAIAAAILAGFSISVLADSDPWTQGQTVEPGVLAKELKNSTSAPMVIFVGFHRLYTAGHIKGAVYHGTTSSPEGLKEFTDWVKTQPRAANIVIYCGCCPMEHCPNVRPAFKELQSLGFHHIRVLILPNDFATDWAGQGLSYEKGD